MKLNEIQKSLNIPNRLNEQNDSEELEYLKDTPGFLTDREEILAWLKKYDSEYAYEKYTINPDSSVNVTGSFWIDPDEFRLEYLKVKFRHIIGGSFIVKGQNFTSFDGFPRTMIGLNISGQAFNLLNLEGIHEKIDKFYEGRLILNDAEYTGGIGLILIPGLKDIYGGNQPMNIVKKYLGRPDDIFECQTELIEAGFELTARL